MFCQLFTIFFFTASIDLKCILLITDFANSFSVNALFIRSCYFMHKVASPGKQDFWAIKQKYVFLQYICYQEQFFCLLNKLYSINWCSAESFSLSKLLVPKYFVLFNYYYIFVINLVIVNIVHFLLLLHWFIYLLLQTETNKLD